MELTVIKEVQIDGWKDGVYYVHGVSFKQRPDDQTIIDQVMSNMIAELDAVLED